MQIFSTDGHTLYHVRPATVAAGGGRAIVAAAYDGAVLCFDTAGRRLWQAEIEGAFPFDLCVADLNGDGLDEALVAAGDGALYAFGPDGRRLWTFRRGAPLYQVCAARQRDGRHIILTGGVEQTLYALSADGAVRGQLAVGISIRHLRAGDVCAEGRELVAMATTTGALNGKLGLSLLDPETLVPLWALSELGVSAPNSGRRFFSMALADLDADGKAEILLSGSLGEQGRIYAFDQDGRQKFSQADARIPDVPYRMNMLVPAVLDDGVCIVGQFGNVLMVYNADGSCREVVTGAQAWTNAAFDPVTRTLYGGSEVSGGDELVAIHLDRPGWQQAVATAKPVGKLARIVANLEELREQVARFERPPYQPEPRPADVLLLDEYHLRAPEILRAQTPAGRLVRYVAHLALGQKPEPGELWCRDRSAFSRYDLTADELVAEVRRWEERGWPFVLQAGHTTAMHLSPATFARVLQAAPRHLWGFEFSEPGEELNEREREIVNGILLPLAERCRKHGGKRILLRTKNIFWNGSVHLPLWRDALMDPRYRDVFVPCLEETNSRSQELSLAGRLGLWLSGVFDRWACRAETDNACFNRMWEWSSQQVLSHHVRSIVSCAAQGADVFFNSIHQGPFSPALEAQLHTAYAMLESGAVFIPSPAQLASVSEVALAMRAPPAAAFLRHGTNGRHYRYPQDEQPAMVFDRLDCYWGGAPLAAHDFSRYAFGVERRLCNFLPLTPHGMVAIVPDDTRLDSAGGRHFARRIDTDGQSFYDASGQARGPAAYAPTVTAALREAAIRLPVVVRGAAHWAAAWIDDAHLRVTLIDPGYLDPADRDVEIVWQQPGRIRCHDVLRQEALPVRDGAIPVRIPMGALRIVDVIRE